MCASAAILEGAVQSAVANREMFTGFDITRTAQTTLGLTERHRNVHGEYHRFFSNGQMADYRKCMVTFPGVPVDAVLFYPPEKDPADYVSPHTGIAPVAVDGRPVAKKIVGAVTQVTTVGSLTATPAAPVIKADTDNTDLDDEADDDEEHYRVDGRGRVCLPKKLVAGLGLVVGSIAYAVKSQNVTSGEPALTVKNTLGPADTEAVAYKVDKSGNIRVSKGCLEEAGLTGTAFEIDGDNSAVVVTKASAVAATASLSAT